MQAVTYYRYGSPDVLQVEEVATPAPADDEVLIKVHAVSLNGADKENLIGSPLYARLAGLTRPQHPILGSDIAGRVEDAGKNVTDFQVGDEIFGELPGYHGGLAEYVCTTGRAMTHKPAGLSFAEAAAIPQAGVIALQGIREKGRVQPGQRVLVNGGGGSAGCFAIQLARLYGAEVTGVDSGEKLDFMRGLGAHHVIDYTREDFTRRDEGYDLILDVIAHRSVWAYRRALRPQGTCYVVGGAVATLLQAALLGGRVGRGEGKRIAVLAVAQSRTNLVAITQLCEAGQIKPVIDRQYSLKQAPDAFRYLVGGHARGKIVITL